MGIAPAESGVVCVGCRAPSVANSCPSGCRSDLATRGTYVARTSESDRAASAGHKGSGWLAGVYLLLGCIAVGCFIVVPAVAGAAWLFELVGLSSAAAIAVGVV